ncbi:MAG: glycosyltransferase family 39 protein, partial [Syntrophus sp. (in: bacteria)]
MVWTYVAIAFIVYRNISITARFSRRDLIAIVVILCSLLLSHIPSLQYNLAGDELYHAEPSSFILSLVKTWVESLPAVPMDIHRQNIWHLFDPRHVAVLDISRVISLLVITIVVCITLILKGIKLRWILWPALILLAGLTTWYGSRASLDSNLHPPFRLFPLFVSQTLLGLNNFAFRIPGIMTLGTLCYLNYRLIQGTTTSTVSFRHLIPSVAICFIPVVFYASEAVEPSIYGFFVMTATLLLGWRFMQTQDIRFLVLSGVIIGVGSVMRQTTIAAWPVIIVLFVLSKHRFNLRAALQVFLPGLLALPYYLMIARHGHYLLVDEGPLLPKLLRSIISGVGPMSILNNATIPWAVFSLLTLGYALFKAKSKELALFLAFIPAYIIFHNARSYLWDCGRYQAEYVAPFIVFALFLAWRYADKIMRVVFSLAMVFLVGITIELNTNLSLDANYDKWPQMRITTSANFPYRDALGYVKRAEAEGRFILLGGQPWYGDMVLWLSGHTFA